jgi:hypothetical protein
MAINLSTFLIPDSLPLSIPEFGRFWQNMSHFWITRSGVATFCKISTAASLAGTAGWQLWTMNCYFEPFGPKNDPLFQSQYFKQHNPGNHPSLNDSCVRKVPLSQIPPELVDDALNGGSKLTERFCAGVWGGYGMCSRASRQSKA